MVQTSDCNCISYPILLALSTASTTSLGRSRSAGIRVSLHWFVVKGAGGSEGQSTAMIGYVAQSHSELWSYTDCRLSLLTSCACVSVSVNIVIMKLWRCWSMVICSCAKYKQRVSCTSRLCNEVSLRRRLDRLTPLLVQLSPKAWWRSLSGPSCCFDWLPALRPSERGT